MSGLEIKNYIANMDDVCYHIVVVNENGEKIYFNDIDDNTIYTFEKIDELIIGSGMLKVYYSIKK